MSFDLAVVIVTWNNRLQIADALRSLLDDLAASSLRARVVVVDSASADGTAALVQEQFPQVECIASAENIGFARGNNLALRHLGYGGVGEVAAPYVYLLNPDTITQAGATAALLAVLRERPDVGVAGARLSFGDGSFQHSAFGFPGLRQLWAEFFWLPGRWREGRFNGRYTREQYAQSAPFGVDFVLGATMMLRAEVIAQTGMFDEAYFMYCEEVDWQWRIHEAGWRVVCVPQAHVVHLGGQSSGQVKPRSLTYLWESRLRMIDKLYPRWKARLARRLIAVGMQRKAQHMNADAEDEQSRAILAAYRHIHALAVRP